MAFKVYTSKFRQLTYEVTQGLEKALQGETIRGQTSGLLINQAALKVQVTRFLKSATTQEHLKKILLASLDDIEQDYQRKLYHMLLGTGTTRTSQSFKAKVQAAFSPNAATRRTNAWINEVWGGDWYAYKRSLASRRLVKTGKKDIHGKDVYRVYAGRLGNSSKERDSSYYFDVGQMKAGDSAKRFNKTLRSAKGGGSIGADDDMDHTPGTFDLEHMTQRLNPRKVGKRAAAATGMQEHRISSYALARSVLLAEQLRDGVKDSNSKGTSTISTKRGKSGIPKGKIPYARTGQMAGSFAGSFTLDKNSIKVSSTPGDGFNLQITMSAKFRLNSMAAEYRRQFLRTPVNYKNMVVTYSGRLFSELLAKEFKNRRY